MGYTAAHFWKMIRSWLRRVLGVAVTVLILYRILLPVIHQWHDVRHRVLAINLGTFFIAAITFAAFLFVFRACTWRRILRGLGHDLPIATATRIWSSSELARYLPGVIWQVVGRVYLVRPYGISATVCSTSQVLELTIFLLANVLMAVGCLLYAYVYFGAHHMAEQVRPYMVLVAALIPLLLAFLHPRVFYGAINRVLRKLNKPEISGQFSAAEIFKLLAWSMLGLVVQSFAIWLVVSTPLQLEAAKWWLVAGAYCLAWCGGFLAFWAPGGLGVREFIFVFALLFALPPGPRSMFSNRAELQAFLGFLGILLRLWATAGELILSGLAHAADFRGAIGRADAPGRITVIAMRESV